MKKIKHLLVLLIFILGLYIGIRFDGNNSQLKNNVDEFEYEMRVL